MCLLEKAIEGLKPGETLRCRLSRPLKHSARIDPEQIVELDHDLFVVDGKFDDEMVKVGALVPMMTADGYRINGKVISVTPEKVTMDFNHPLAGKDVRFSGSIITVREATPEELQPAHGCGGCGGGCNCDGDSCGDSCGGCGSH